jgi:CDP-glucose 4,6-dehydratase
MEDLDLNRFWKGKRVLVTGHTGFKGGWLSLWLGRLGAQVHGFALKAPTQPSLFEEARVAEGMTSTIGDIRDPESLQSALGRAEPEVVFHLAAQPIVRQSYAEPVETFHTNVMGTVNVLEAVRHAPSVRAVVNVTTDKCYENREWQRGYREDDPLGGHDPYSGSKACAEIVGAVYRRSFLSSRADGGAVGVANARAGNVIGGGDWARDRLIPDMIRAIVSGVPVRIRNPASTRPWQHVLEPLSAYLLLARRLLSGDVSVADAWNFGPDASDVRPVSWILDRWAARWGEGFAWSRDDGDHPHEARLLQLDIGKARERLGWRPRWPLEDGLDRTIDWYREWRRGGDMRAATIRQIEEFSACR